MTTKGIISSPVTSFYRILFNLKRLQSITRICDVILWQKTKKYRYFPRNVGNITLDASLKHCLVNHEIQNQKQNTERKNVIIH